MVCKVVDKITTHNTENLSKKIIHFNNELQMVNEINRTHKSLSKPPFVCKVVDKIAAYNILNVSKKFININDKRKMAKEINRSHVTLLIPNGL